MCSTVAGEARMVEPAPGGICLLGLGLVYTKRCARRHTGRWPVAKTSMGSCEMDEIRQPRRKGRGNPENRDTGYSYQLAAIFTVG